MTRPSAKTFLITGVSSGFGRALAEAALRDGHVVAGTVRTARDKETFEALSERAHAVILDVTDTARVAPVVAGIEERVGAIDVLVNNAGYGHEGILEESSIDDLRRQFEVNVFGAVAMIQAVLPAMRQRRAGHIINITSMGGIITFPGLSFYHGSKFALEGISGALGKEVRDFGIKVTAIEPGGFRTDWAGRSMVRAERSIADYDAIFEPVRKRRMDMSGRQVGDPAKAAQAMLKVVMSDHPPANLLLGSDAVRLVEEQMTARQADFEAWKTVSLATDVT
ncbi:oxidoreductase [Bradyrhizobium sp. U87765 SZCCT0131]|uniref:oxidoreductase n=1 Tax=unclassified Bradyrhizobium TaxID=2631580 RepID=UPI001BAC2B3E|nr:MULTISPECIES: oxidoreductase [unclassified Bradyrhizobium]MBR1221276.1 oxidoreductase [Bradyrhizobium sp. U87765 SZCCT0131]MBR1259903.1 oxidoreductase [Bradyrhizobium sp. U87765 SZCCT0134]MBR1307848.1 oxidoreductase [Bradyrhizobium sp. U87765 SZCCT0110]MBR1321802.1 oxidoreductase [Bradyrhizobium sp. U87765 SZCCT0109]MBR1350114.1 oxidoreductase [Bradyrhizobium sp. U87765 SZCCT0048]